MSRIHIAALLSLGFSLPAAAEPVSNSLAQASQEITFKADYSAEPALAVLQDPEPSVGDPFAQGQWIWTLYGGGAFWDDAGDVYQAHLGIGYHVLDNLSFNLEGVFAAVNGDEGDVTDGSISRDAVGGGLDLILRWHFWRRDNFTIYLDGGCGIIVFDEEFPGHGTNLNFTPQAGMGFTLDLNDKLMLMAGARWYHISNARHSGIVNNPGFDGGLVYAGVMWPF